MSSENQIQPSFRLVLYVALILSALSFLKTDFTLGKFSSKKIDLFSDLKEKKAEKKIVRKIIPPQPPAKDSLAKKENVLLLERYESDTSFSWKNLFTKIQSVQKGDKTKVRIAWFGDSLIEGDIITQDARSALQKKFGGSGVGFVLITTHVPGFRQTINWTFADSWKTFSLTDSVKHKVPYGPYGQVYMPRKISRGTDSATAAGEASWVKYSSVKSSLKGLDTLYNISLYYSRADSGDYILYSLNGSSSFKKLFLSGGSKISKLDLNQNLPVHSVQIKFVPNDTLFVYGLSFESQKGIFIDNYSLRGSSGIHLSGVKQSVWKQFQQVRNYDLIVFQYGVNIASPTMEDYSWYENSFGKTIKFLKTTYTQTPIVIIGCTDRSIKKDGKYVTMPTIYSLINSQRDIASDNKISFWDLFTAMGGDSSMIRMADAKPPLANKDYTHFKATGGKVVADDFVQSLLFEYNWFLQNPVKKK